jgi:diguanylate cyclase (GGDEF)-like protein
MNWQFLKHLQDKQDFISRTAPHPSVPTPTPRWRRYLRLASPALLGGMTAVFVAGLSALGTWQPLEQLAYRTLFKLRGPIPWDDRVAIIAIDEASLRTLGRYPWGREEYAKLLDVLSQAGSSVVAFDILFPEPSPADAQLAAAMDRHGRVVLSMVWDEGTTPLLPTPQLRESALEEGHVRTYADSDGITRYIESYSFDVPALYIAVAKAYSLTAELVKLPKLDEPLWINWLGPTQLAPEYSFADVVQGKVPGAAFKNKIVLVGATATGLDPLHTPFNLNPAASGVHLHATALSNLLQENYLRPMAPGWFLLIWVLGGPVLSVVIAPWRFERQIACWVGLCVSWGVVSFLMFRAGYLLPVATPLVLFSLTGGVIALQERLRMRARLQQSEEQLQFSASHDALTGLSNRILFLDAVERVMSTSLNERLASEKPLPDRLFAVLFLDLDRFKVINDSLGHSVGDRLLVAIAQRLKACLHPTDTIARFGGDEFAILLSPIHDLSDATYVAEVIHTALAKPFQLHNYEVFTTASIGIALGKTRNNPLPDSNGERQKPEESLLPQRLDALRSCNYEQPEEILRDADIALHQAKELGKSCYAVFNTTLHTRALVRLELETDLRRAMEELEPPHYQVSGQTFYPSLLPNPQFQIYYQPIVSLKTGQIAGFEALVRWQHPKRGLVSPVEFIPLAEETGMMTALDWWVLRAACRQLQIWQERIALFSPQASRLPWGGADAGFPYPDTGVGRLTMSVNLSSLQLKQLSLIEQVKQILEETGVSGDCLRLEITEGCLLDNSLFSITPLQQLRDLGIQLAIDDFGTGYSSLSRLHGLPINTLKIDRSFVTRLNHQQEGVEIVQAILTLAQSLGMDVVAEGIETQEQLARLKALHCDYGQGYYFAKPLDTAAATALIAKSYLDQN